VTRQTRHDDTRTRRTGRPSRSADGARYRPRHEARTLARDTPGPVVTPLRPTGPSGPNARLLFLMVIVVLAAAGLTFRLVQLQVLSPERYVAKGLEQRTRAIALPGPRGEILDRNGNRLAISIPQNTFFVDPQLVIDPGAASEVLSPVLGESVSSLYEKFTADSHFVYLARQVSDEMAHTIQALDVPGVYSLEEPTRFNPAGGDLGGSFIGRVGIDSQPLSGLEYKYDDVLAGVAGELIVEKAPQGQTIPVGPREVQPAQPGSDLVLTVDRSLQFEVEQILMRQVDAMVAKGGIAIVTETDTGAILAVASVTRDSQLNVILSPTNQAANWAFEPGSVMKAITFASVMDAGLAEPHTVRPVASTFDLYDQTFSDIHDHPTTDWTVSDIVTQSSNVGSVMWATELGADRFEPYIRSFGLTDQVLGLGGETSGLLEDREDWDGTKIGAVALGQAISVSGLQMIQAFNVIANDGIKVPLRLVEETVSPDGEVELFAVAEPERVISAGTASEMRSILRNVVAAGTGQAAAVDGYEVAGKTGTARKPLPTGGYQDANGQYHYVSSFVGFLPANDPEISILVTLDEPAVSTYASVVAAPVFSEIAHYALRHFSIPPSAALLEAAPLTIAGDTIPEDGIIADNPAPLPEAPEADDELLPAADAIDGGAAETSQPPVGAIAPSVVTEAVDPVGVQPTDAMPIDAMPIDAMPIDAMPAEAIAGTDAQIEEAAPSAAPAPAPTADNTALDNTALDNTALDNTALDNTAGDAGQGNG